MGKVVALLIRTAFAGALLLSSAGRPAWGFPGGGPGFGMLPVTDASPSCAACHANTKAEYMREVPADAPLNAQNQLIENKHYKTIEAGEGAYKLLSVTERERLLKQVKLVDQNTSIAISAPKEASRGKQIKVEVSAKGGIGPGGMVMLLDTDLRMQARPVQGTGWRIIGPPEVIGPDGKKQTFWVDKRVKGLAKDVNAVVVGGGADVEKAVYPTFKVTYTLGAPARAGKYTLTAAFLYGTEEPNEHKVEGKWTLPPGGITGPSGRILFSEVVEVEVK
jgi:hypothetical protein